MNESMAWINGSFCSFAEAAVPAWDLGVVAGAAVTEMARTYHHQPFRLSQHVGRLMSSLQALQFPVNWSADELIAAAEHVAAKNSASLRPGQDLGIVLFSTAGSNPTYLAGRSDLTTTVVHTFELPFPLWKPSLRNGVRLRVPAIRQVPKDCFPVEHKVRNRLHWWLADRQAAELEAGSKALLLDHEGFVTETSTSCFYLVHDNRIVTSDRHVLKSLSSQLVEELAGQLQIPFERRRIASTELLTAEEAFLSSTPVGILSVSHIDGRPLQGQHSGSVASRLMQAWNEYVGLDLAAQIEQA